MYCSKTRTPIAQASPSNLPCEAAPKSIGGNDAPAKKVAAVAGLWSSRGARAVVLTQQASRPQQR